MKLPRTRRCVRSISGSVAMTDPSNPTLSCEALCAGWGETQVISDISLVIPPGEMLIVLGRNGVGKSTLLASIIGRATYREGRIVAFGRSIEALPVYERVKLGIGYVPQEREVFPSLSVEENLLVAARIAAGAASHWTFE